MERKVFFANQCFLRKSENEISFNIVIALKKLMPVGSSFYEVQFAIPVHGRACCLILCLPEFPEIRLRFQHISSLTSLRERFGHQIVSLFAMSDGD